MHIYKQFFSVMLINQNINNNMFHHLIICEIGK